MYKQPRNLMALSGVALALMALGAPAQADTASPTLNDVRQEVQISTTYALNPYLRSDNLKASVRDGKATLTGKVAEGINKDLANEIARSRLFKTQCNPSILLFLCMLIPHDQA